MGVVWAWGWRRRGVGVGWPLSEVHVGGSGQSVEIVRVVRESELVRAK